MTIGIDGRLWNETGVGRYIRNLVTQLSAIDVENRYVLFVDRRDSEKLKSGDNLRDKSPGLNKNWEIVETNLRWHSLEEQLSFPKIINQAKVDLMHFTYFSVPVFYNKPFVVTIHDLIINHFSTGRASTLPLPVYYLKREGYKFVMRNAAQKAKKIIVPLEAVKEDVMRTYDCEDEKIVVTPEGVDESFGKFGKDKISGGMKPFFLYVGNAYPHKNLEKLIDGFGLMSKEDHEVELWLVGKKDFFYERLEKKIRAMNIERVHFKYDLDDKQLFFYYSQAIALVSASLMEGFGLPPAEAAMCGCPVVLSDIPAFREVWGGGVEYFDPNDVKDIGAKMMQMRRMSESARRKYVEENRKLVEKLSWRKMAEKTLVVYENCIGV